jgi:hypothetical protein
MRLRPAAATAVALSLGLSGLSCVTSEPYHHESDEHYARTAPPVQNEHHEGQDDHQQNGHQQNEHHEGQDDHQQNDH